MGSSPTACAIIVERTGDLSGDVDEDDGRIKALTPLHPFAPDGSVPADIISHLVRDIRPRQLALGRDWLLSRPIMRSLAKGIVPG